MTKKYNTQKCYESHKVIDLGRDLEIYGGSCLSPIRKDLDVYISLEAWHRPSMVQATKPDVIHIDHYIPNMGVPPNVKLFKELIANLADAVLNAGVSVHVGCIGGHGRTGLVLSALQNYINDDPDSTNYIRTNYCTRAVESNAQIEWLHRHFGIIRVEPVASKYPIRYDNY